MRDIPDLDQIMGFLTVAETLNFRRAAERLAIDQSALSRRIKGLEQRLGFALLFRTTHAVRLTDAGRAFYEANRGIVDRLRATIDHAGRIARGATGTLRIGYMTFAAMAFMPMVIRVYTKSYPDVALSMTYLPTMAQKLSLARGDIDVALMLGPFTHSDFDTITVASERIVAVMHESHPLAASAALTLRDVAAEPLVLGTHDEWDFYRATLAELLALSGLDANIAYETPSLIGILGLVRAGLGLTLLPEVMQRFCPKGLVTRPIRDADVPIVTVAAWRRPPEGNVAAFIQTVASLGPPC
jgi:DNA-binding transcriptional LysR family regulator